jgi:hypothetical protein
MKRPLLISHTPKKVSILGVESVIVDFMLIGAQKCGTTSLAAQLADHPDICFCEVKEPGYFHQTVDWRAGLEAYHNLYQPHNGQLCGEASTMYTFSPEYTDTHVRLHAYNPDLKLIYMMRQPVERIVSHYTHNFVRQIDTNPPEVAITKDPAYINRSLYSMQIRPFIEKFGSDKVMLVLFEDYVADQVGTLKKIASFLNIEPTIFEQSDTTPKHKSTGNYYLKSEGLRMFTKSALFRRIRPFVPAGIRQPIRRRFSQKINEKPEFSAGLKQNIWEMVEDDVSALENLLNRRLVEWRQGYTA